MCGIFGFAGLVNENRQADFERFMTALAVATQSRGYHATGMCAYMGKHRAHVAKGPVKAEEFVRTPSWAKAMTGAKSMIGHCRWATHGSPQDNRNNHPFETERLALIHNGVISGYERIAKNEGVTLKSQCDSEVILRVVAKGAGRKCDVLAGLDAWQRATAHVDSDYAVAVMDKYNGVIRLLRDDGRPCAVIKLPSLNIVAFASTKEILNLAFNKMVQDCGNDELATKLMEGAEAWDLKIHKVYVLNFAGMEVENEQVWSPPPPKQGHLFGGGNYVGDGKYIDGSPTSTTCKRGEMPPWNMDEEEAVQCPMCGGVMAHDASCQMVR